MQKIKYKYLTKWQLEQANQQAIAACCNAIDPSYIERLPDGCKYPVFFRLPWERRGWVRCQIGTATCLPAEDYTPVLLDVPQAMFDELPTVEVQVEEGEEC
jgi:hypothetical protein